ncbi:MAG: chalcone isomerase family protein [Opitutales bacterium]|nr:chalcone isomerase family protein [Opitutales bacterium]
MKNLFVPLLVISLFLSQISVAVEEKLEVYGVEIPKSKILGETEVQLNGVALRKALGVIKVYVGAFYIEKPSNSVEEIIASRQVKHFYLYYLTEKATGKKVSRGFVKAIEKANSKDDIASQRENIDLYASWINVDMKPGSTSESIYHPGMGITLRINGQEKGTIADPGFAEVYFQYVLGDKADEKLKNAYLGLTTVDAD